METRKISDRFTARIVRDGDFLFHGIRSDWSRERREYEQGTIIEIYDRRYPHTALGQFVTAYNAMTLTTIKPGTKLALWTDIPDWHLTLAETDALREIATITA